MAFTRATGKHRRPSRSARTTRNIAGIAGLAASGVVVSVSSPAMAATSGAAHDTGLQRAVVLGDELAERVQAQADAQQAVAETAEAKAKAEAEAEKQAQAAKAAADKRHDAKVRAAREEERKRLNAFVAPISGSYVSTAYQASSGLWSSGTHTGIDFHAAPGTTVHAVGAGTVVEAGWGGAYGNNIVIKMNDGTYTQYGHLSQIGVSVGQQVMPHQQIGLSGATGNVTGPHLHFEARTGPDYGSDIDPISYLRSHGVNV
ncbi:M23 family metallopeptidase [Streptomyces sp. NBC_01525]|uniref:M23 family metallopeptidase n=1 Tax=Streptomyces benahoarensis TaxID=2595054 RepID=A0A553ZBR3_9ACTN|nr:M23 family metallopeptidase [Streptomyces benahoarensis]TSB30074.1 M23 family metallopeptidase [Streptomyces benahoarensis]TSB38861.1 M23 family metallopeptidase [Streptomyces benahoarensis]